MEFTLHYRGKLKANGNPSHKQSLRRHFHKQLAILWNQLPLSDRHGLLKKDPPLHSVGIIRPAHGFNFAPLINEKLCLVAELKITMLRPEPPGRIITGAGDIDNRLKTLFDALKVPTEPTALPTGDKPSDSEDPFYCLLEDDILITKVTVETDRLLYPCENKSEVELLVHVTAKATRSIWANMGLG